MFNLINTECCCMTNHHKEKVCSIHNYKLSWQTTLVAYTLSCFIRLQVLSSSDSIIFSMNEFHFHWSSDVISVNLRQVETYTWPKMMKYWKRSFSNLSPWTWNKLSQICYLRSISNIVQVLHFPTNCTI